MFILSQHLDELYRHARAVSRAEKKSCLSLTCCEDMDDYGVSRVLDSLRVIRPATLHSLTALHIAASSCFAGSMLHREITLLPALRELRLFDCTAVSDSAVQAVTQMTNLQLLHLDGCTSVTDSGLRNISNLRALSGLWLSGCRISDVTMHRVACIVTLCHLCVKGCVQVTEEGLSSVRRLPKLNVLLKPNGQVEMPERQR